MTTDDDNLRALLDRQAIAECVHRYSRGIDRQDAELVASCYHPDAVDDHGTFVGLGAELAPWVFARSGDIVSSQNHITTHAIELDGDTAHSEAYYLVIRRAASGTVMYSSGRYVDRFQRRNGEWKIAGRLCIVESVVELPGMETAHRSDNASRRDRTDPSYERPLCIRTGPDEPYPSLR